MGIAGIKIKIMPESPESNLDEITEKAKAIVAEKGGKNREYEEEPEAYDVNLCIDDFQDPKRLKTQEHETGDYE